MVRMITRQWILDKEHPYILLCFPKGATKLCRKSDGYEWTELSQTGYPHDFTYALSSYNDQPFITGAYSNIKTEVYQDGKWNYKADYPFGGNR